jgi:hypothetical protein
LNYFSNLEIKIATPNPTIAEIAILAFILPEKNNNPKIRTIPEATRINLASPIPVRKRSNIAAATDKRFAKVSFI